MSTKTLCKVQKNRIKKDDKFTCDKCKRTSNKGKKLCKPKQNSK